MADSKGKGKMLDSGGADDGLSALAAPFEGLLSERQYLRQVLEPATFRFDGKANALEPRRSRLPLMVTLWEDAFEEVEAFVMQAPDSPRKYRSIDPTFLEIVTDHSESDLNFFLKYLLHEIGRKLYFKKEDEFSANLEKLVATTNKLATAAQGVEAMVVDVANCIPSSGGKIDIVCRLKGIPFLAFESKLPCLFRSASDIPPPDLCPICNLYFQPQDMGVDPNSVVESRIPRAICQLYGYMVDLGLGYGALTSLDLTYLVRRESDTIHISRGIQWADTRLVAALAFLIHKGHTDDTKYIKGKFDNTFKDDGADKGGGGKKKRGPKPGKSPDGQKKRQSSNTGSTIDVGTKQKITQSGRKYSTGAEQCTPDWQEIAAEQLNLDGTILGIGWSGSIAQGTFEGHPVAIKLAPVSSNRAEAFKNEVMAYYKLKKYWGLYVPVLRSYGTTVDGNVLYIATEVVKGFTLGIEAPTKEVVTAAFEALDAIHSSGMLHGDIRRENILVPKGGQCGVRFIDFGFSRCIKDKESEVCKQEQAQLQNIIDRWSFPRSWKP